MTTVIIVIHLMVVLAMIGLILLQRSEGGALGIGGGQGAFMTNRSAGNVLSHTTAYLALAFFLTSLGLAFIAKYQSHPSDILERLPGASAPAATETQQPGEPMAPPTNAKDLLKELNSTSGGPQTPPTANGAPAANGAAPAPATTTPQPSAPAPATNTPAAPAPTTTPAPQAAPAPQAPPAPTPAP
jgi:preprotein translocase subunit SecG